MKKTLLFMSAALLGLAACQNEISPVEKPSEDNTQIKDYPYELCFTALNESSVKTTLNDTQILWEDNDEIKVFWGVGKSNKAVGSLNEDKTSATFNTKVEEAETYYAIYPYTEAECMTEDGKIVVEIPAIQNGAFRNANIMLAKAEDYTLNFKHLVGLMEFTTDLTGTIEIAGAEGDILTGTVTVTGFEENGAPVYEVADGSNTIKLEITEPGTYYAAFLPSAELECLTIKMTNGEGDAKTTEYALSANGIEMGRGRLVPLGDITGQFGKNLFVKADADGNGDGKTWETALSYAQVAAMLTLAEADGKIFNFAAGEYKNDEQIYINKATGDELLKISFKGGYAASSTGTDLTKNDPSTNVTKITGADEKRAFRIGRRIDMTFKGVTFSGGNGDGDVDENSTNDGGGILIADNDSGNSILTFDNCAFSGNTSSSGGAFVTKAAKVVLKGCTLSGNTATDRGGAIFVNNAGTLEINGGTFTTNKAANEGGVIYCNDDTKVTIANASFSENKAEAKAGGVIYASSNAVIKLTNTSFTKNQASGDVGGVVYITSKATLDITGGEYNENVAKRGSVIYSSGTGKISINDAVMNKNTSNNATSGNVFGGAIRILDITPIDIIGGTYSENYASQKGGFLYCEKGEGTKATITISGAVIDGNKAGASGGGIFINGLPTVIIKDNTVISNNQAKSYGGGLLHNGVDGATYEISNTTFEGNKCDESRGGAIYSSKGKFTISKTKFIKNTVASQAGSYGGGAISARQSTLTISECEFIQNKSADRGGAISAVDAAQTYKITDCIFDGNESYFYGSAISSKNTSLTLYMNNCTFKNSVSTYKWDDDRIGTLCLAGNIYINNCLFHNNYNSLNKRNITIIFDSEKTSKSTAKTIGLVMNTTVIEASQYERALAVGSSYVDATIINNVLLSNYNGASIQIGTSMNNNTDYNGYLKSGGYNYFNSYSFHASNSSSTYTLAEGATEVADATYAEGSALFTDQYMWKAAPAQTMTTAAELSTWVKANVTGGDAFITWLDTVDGLTKDLAGNPRGSGSIYPGCYQN